MTNPVKKRYLPVQPDQQVPLPTSGGQTATVHVFEPDAILAVNAAIAAERALLVRGDPGTGKSQLARAVAQALEVPLLSKVIDGSTEARDLLWTFDAVARLAEAQIQGALAGRGESIDAKREAEVRARLDPRRFVAPGPLWFAFDWQQAKAQAERIDMPLPAVPKNWNPTLGSVVLLDEIDKADVAVPNALLETLGNRQFPTLQGEVVHAQAPVPLVLITTNEERALPDAFVRRCLVLHLALPEDDVKLRAWLLARGRAHFGTVDDTVLQRAADLIATARADWPQHEAARPGQAEFLDLIRAVSEQEPSASKQRTLLDEIAKFALRKHADERESG